MAEPKDVIQVLDSGQPVGALSSVPNRDYFAFQYFPEWVQNGYSISPILMPLENRIFAFPELSRETYQGLPPAIADALPDRFGNAIITAELQKQGLGYRDITPIDRLSYVGKRSMGSLEFKPTFGNSKISNEMLRIGKLVEAARMVLSGDFKDEDDTSKAVKQIIKIGTSAGGARAKAVINVDDETGIISSGQFPAESKTGWLLKFDSMGSDAKLDHGQVGQSEDFCRIEYAYSLMAKEAGINMPETRLLEEGGRAHFMVRRFDRPSGKRKLGMQSLCGIAAADFNLRGVNDYSILVQTGKKLELPEEDFIEMFRRLVFNYLAFNCDDHTKNFAFLRGENGVWRLSPAYDVTFAYDPTNYWLSQHLMGVDGKFQDVTKQDLIEFARHWKIPYAFDVYKKAKLSISKWREFAKEAGVLDIVATDIDRLLNN
ncbi:MAG: type II toxin-antitoxin system HipA family toxin [Candidatus Ancillula sp.]|jgi:serine/threonine-protein kinase HipA|nr:type II toxin-antitoxin system HipA family toxin [Candidatus Ancillula sp.]